MLETYKQIAEIILNGGDLEDLFEAGKKDFTKPVLRLIDRGFSINDAGLFFRERIIASSIYRALKSNVEFNQTLLTDLNLPFKEVEVPYYDAIKSHTHAIRVDASGVIRRPKKSDLSLEYNKLMGILYNKHSFYTKDYLNVDENLNNIKEMMTLEPKEAKPTNKKRKKKLIKKMKEQASEPEIFQTPIYPIEQYNLNTSADWQECLSTFIHSFALIEEDIRKTLKKINFPPSSIKTMTTHDFFDIIYLMTKEDNETTERKPFQGAFPKRTIAFANSFKHQELIRKHLLLKDLGDNAIESIINNMQSFGNLSKYHSYHHIDYVRFSEGGFDETGKVDYNKTNSPSNTPLFDSRMHQFFIHSRDKVTNGGDTFRKLSPNSNYDMMLGFTEAFCIKTQKENTIINTIAKNNQQQK